VDAVLNWLWQGSVVAAALAVLLRLMARARAESRYAVCWAALLCVFALPVLPLFGGLDAAPGTGAPAAVQTTTDTKLVVPVSWWTSSLVFTALWVIWSGVHSARLVSAMLMLRRIRRRSRGFSPMVERQLSHWMTIRHRGRRTALVVSDRIRAAAVLAWGAPLIAVAPSLIEQLDREELDRIVIHEWAHIQRGDDRANLWQLIIRAIAGWHPAVWWIDRRLRMEREIACDEMTVAVTGSPKLYAACLMRLAGLPLAGWQSAAAPGASARLRPRIVRLVSPRPLVSPTWSRSAGAAASVMLCAVSFSIAGVRMIAIASESSGDPANGVASDVVSNAPRLQTPIAASRLRPVAPAGHAEWQQARATTPPARPAPVAPPRAAPSPAPSDPAPPTRQRETSPGAVTEAASEALGAPLMTPLQSRPMDAVVALGPGAWMAKSTDDAPPGRSPWDAAADAGAAIGRGSQTAGVATAGFFSRFAKRVARSF
jgi:beta-lactamase regulating signal transducer with metallopeptidase domain